jgi:hypothetical protein
MRVGERARRWWRATTTADRVVVVIALLLLAGVDLVPRVVFWLDPELDNRSRYYPEFLASGGVWVDAHEQRFGCTTAMAVRPVVESPGTALAVRPVAPRRGDQVGYKRTEEVYRSSRTSRSVSRTSLGRRASGASSSALP